MKRDLKTAIYFLGMIRKPESMPHVFLQEIHTIFPKAMNVALMCEHQVCQVYSVCTYTFTRLILLHKKFYWDSFFHFNSDIKLL